MTPLIFKHLLNSSKDDESIENVGMDKRDTSSNTADPNVHRHPDQYQLF